MKWGELKSMNIPDDADVFVGDAVGSLGIETVAYISHDNMVMLLVPDDDMESPFKDKVEDIQDAVIIKEYRAEDTTQEEWQQLMCDIMACGDPKPSKEFDHDACVQI